MTSGKLFISHSSKDVEVAKMLVDFFVGCGLPRNDIFCSSVDGCGPQKKVAEEIKQALRISKTNLMILSENYNSSIYCANEAGIIWYCDEVPTLKVALPEIHSSGIMGFQDRDCKLYHLGDGGAFNIWDSIVEEFDVARNTSNIACQQDKLIERYNKFIKEREQKRDEVISCGDNIDSLECGLKTWPDNMNLTDNELVILKYAHSQSKRKVFYKCMTNGLV